MRIYDSLKFLKNKKICMETEICWRAMPCSPTELRKADRTVEVNCNIFYPIFRQALPDFFRVTLSSNIFHGGQFTLYQPS